MADLLTIAELDALGINPVALGGFTPEQKQLAVDAAVDEAYAWIRQVTGTPIAQAPLALKAHVAKIAVYHLLSARGMDPEADRLVIDNYERALRFLRGVQKGEIILEGMTPPAETTHNNIEGAWIESDPPRWGDERGV